MTVTPEVNRIRESGNLSARVLMKGKDELSNLAVVINHLLVTVQKAQDELEQRVEERTKELIESNKDLKHQILLEIFSEAFFLTG